MNRIYKLTEKGMTEYTQWDAAIAAGEIETVEAFSSYNEAIKAYEDGNYDEDLYGVE